MDVYVQQRVMSPGSVWEEKDQFFKDARKSKEIFDSMPEEDQREFVDEVRTMFQALADRAESFAQEALVAPLGHSDEGTDVFDVRVRLIMRPRDKGRN